MPSKVKPIPPGFHTITPNLTVDNAARAIEFYKKAFGAEELGREPGPGGKIIHAELKIGTSMLFLNDDMMGSLKGTTGSRVMLHLYVEDVDSLFKRAVDAGAKVKMPLNDMFWGDRYGQLADPFGQDWSLGTHKEDVSPDEMKRRTEKYFAEMAKQPK